MSHSTKVGDLIRECVECRPFAVALRSKRKVVRVTPVGIICEPQFNKDAGFVRSWIRVKGIK